MSQLSEIDNSDTTDTPNGAVANYEYLGADTIVRENYNEPERHAGLLLGNYGGLTRFGQVEYQEWMGRRQQPVGRVSVRLQLGGRRVEQHEPDANRRQPTHAVRLLEHRSRWERPEPGRLVSQRLPVRRGRQPGFELGRANPI